MILLCVPNCLKLLSFLCVLIQGLFSSIDGKNKHYPVSIFFFFCFFLFTVWFLPRLIWLRSTDHSLLWIPISFQEMDSRFHTIFQSAGLWCQFMVTLIGKDWIQSHVLFCLWWLPTYFNNSVLLFLSQTWAWSYVYTFSWFLLMKH